MMPLGMARRLLGGARDAAQVATGLAKHAAWYVSYRVEGRAREAERARHSRGRKR